jgi:hypothetical protein
MKCSREPIDTVNQTTLVAGSIKVSLNLPVFGDVV